jgi:hypothetical protein
MMGLIYTPISLLKKSFKPAERSLSREEVIRRLLTFTNDVSLSENYLEMALDHPSSPFREGNSRAIIEYVQQQHPLSVHVYRLIKEAGMPLLEDKILRKLRSLQLVSWNFDFDRLRLMGNPGFVQLEADKRWLLNEWYIANDEIYDYLNSGSKRDISLRDVSYIIQAMPSLSKEKAIFIPEVDKRFILNREMVEVITDSSAHTQSLMEVAVTMSNHLIDRETEQVMISESSKTVVDEVLGDLANALQKLEKRSNEMKQDVLQYFDSNDMSSISLLLKEKEKNEIVLSRISQIVNELSE